LPLWLIAAGWLGTFALVALAVNRARTLDLRRRVPLVGAMAALMLVGMSSEIIPIAYHINLTVVAGILLGPWLSIITALVVVVMLALVGHGGVTVIGLNAIVIAAEMMLGWGLFHAFVRVLGRRRAGLATAGAAVIALALSTTLLVVIVALGGSPAASRESGAFDPGTLSFSNPFAEGVATNVLVSGEETPVVQEAPLSIRRFATMVYTLGAIGWVLEALISALIVSFVARVRPGLVYEGAPSQEARAPVGDEGAHH
jgi:cobalt/nickel transport system permease protein